MSTTAAKHDLIFAVRSLLQSTLHRIKVTVNDIVPPETQANLKQALLAFATSHPVLATLLLSQVAFSGIPLILFIVLTAGIFIFSLVVTLFLGVLLALMFTLFWMGLGSIILIPTLCLTTLTAGGVWLWAWGVYYIVRWVGSGDTALLTRFSLLLTPQKTWAKQDSRNGTHSEHRKDPEQTAASEHDANSSADPVKQKLQSQETNNPSTDLQVSIEPNGYPKKQSNGSGVVDNAAS